MGINNKGFAMIFKVLVALAFFMFLILFMNFVMDEVTRVRDADHLNCSSPDTDGDKIVCLVTDGTIPIYILTGLFVIGAYLAGRHT